MQTRVHREILGRDGSWIGNSGIWKFRKLFSGPVVHWGKGARGMSMVCFKNIIFLKHYLNAEVIKENVMCEGSERHLIASLHLIQKATDLWTIFRKQRKRLTYWVYLFKEAKGLSQASGGNIGEQTNKRSILKKNNDIIILNFVAYEDSQIKADSMF